MSLDVEVSSPDYSGNLQLIVDDLTEKGWSYTQNLITQEQSLLLAQEALLRREKGKFKKAAVGKGEEAAIHSSIRNDQIMWLQDDEAHEVIVDYLRFIESLRVSLNKTLFMGASQFEGHFALYEQGAFYKRHLDCFKDQPRRCLSCLLYLNDQWGPEDGGVLRLYDDPENPSSYQDFPPLGGSFMVFLSDVYEHEVLPAKRDRLSLTGWLKRSDSNPLMNL